MSKLAGSSNSGGSGKKQLYTDIISIKGKKYYLQDQVPVDDALHVMITPYTRESSNVIRATRGNAWPDGLKLKYPKLSSVNATSKLRRRRPSGLPA
eukprot:sb/3479144/